ncbi:unnamed protein product [Cladocopium goreaui]|uniref:Apoptosis-inducing factor 3 (Apoptosis-inducin g factor-like protein) n=1 Tax=Cladocopium goreaui TaxID=2562237 RepID=A0A9P1D1P5_9DINO|nr:unnamed protein product [Cladocopium goreaui]
MANGGLGAVEVQKDARPIWYCGFVKDVGPKDELLIGFEDDIWPPTRYPAAEVRRSPRYSPSDIEKFSPKVGEEVEVRLEATPHAPVCWAIGTVGKIKHDFFVVSIHPSAVQKGNDQIVEKEKLRPAAVRSGLTPEALNQENFQLPAGLQSWMNTEDGIGCFSHIQDQSGLVTILVQCVELFELLNSPTMRWDVRPLAVTLTAVVSFTAGSHGWSQSSCSTTQRVSLGKVSDFEEAGMKEVKLDGGSALLVHRHQGQFYVTSPACSHYGAPLRKGVSSAGGRGNAAPTVTCPLHDACFDLRTGQVVRGPSVDGIAVYRSEVKDDEVFALVPSEIATGGKHQKVLKAMGKRRSNDARCFVLLGGGCASLAAAETLRQEGFAGRIVMVTKENHLPYDRVQLSKALDKPVEKLLLRPESFYKDYDIEVLKGATVTKLNTKDQIISYTSQVWP